MRGLLKFSCLLLAFGLLFGAPDASEAQILKRLKEKAKKTVEKAVNDEAEAAVGLESEDDSDDGNASSNDTGNTGSTEKRSSAGRFQASASSADKAETVDLNSKNYLDKDGTVDPKYLKALYPAEVMGVKRVSLEGKKAGFAGFKQVNAQGAYGDDHGLDVTITDMGGMKGMSALGLFWTQTEIDNETDNGYERTTKWHDFPGMEKQEKNDGGYSSSLDVVIGQRFLINARSNVLSAEQLGKALESWNIGKLIEWSAGEAERLEPVEFAVLRDLLPGSAPGMKRTEAEGEKSEVWGLKTSQARAEFTDDKVGHMTVYIKDHGNTAGAYASAGPWAQQRDKVSDTGFERTTKFKGYPAYEEFNKRSDIPADAGNQVDGMGESYMSGRMEVFVAPRFVVEISGYNIPFETMKAALDQIDLQKLGSLVPPPTAK